MVYFIQPADGGLIKIGFSRDPAMRVAALAKIEGKSLRLLAVVDGGRDGELAMHRRFAHLRVVSEWFQPGPDLLGFIASEGRQWDGTPEPKPRLDGAAAFALRLKALLDNHGYTYREAAEAANLDHMQIWRIVAGRVQNPGFVTLQRIVEAVGGTWHELLCDGEGED